jgi:hypothetical protein
METRISLYTSERNGTSTGSTYTTLFPSLYGDIRWLLVQPDSKAFQFVGEDAEIVERFENVQYDEDEVTSSCD